MEYKKRLIKFSRKQLYDEIWTSSVSGVIELRRTLHHYLSERCFA